MTAWDAVFCSAAQVVGAPDRLAAGGVGGEQRVDQGLVGTPGPLAGTDEVGVLAHESQVDHVPIVGSRAGSRPPRPTSARDGEQGVERGAAPAGPPRSSPASAATMLGGSPSGASCSSRHRLGQVQCAERGAAALELVGQAWDRVLVAPPTSDRPPRRSRSRRPCVVRLSAYFAYSCAEGVVAEVPQLLDGLGVQCARRVLRDLGKGRRLGNGRQEPGQLLPPLAQRLVERGQPHRLGEEVVGAGGQEGGPVAASTLAVTATIARLRPRHATDRRRGVHPADHRHLRVHQHHVVGPLRTAVDGLLPLATALAVVPQLPRYSP